jgi:hypothetical protein
MRPPRIRRPAAAAALALFALFWVATIAEAWCPMHSGRAAAAAGAIAPAAHHGVPHVSQPTAPKPDGAPDGCQCPGDCGGAIVVLVPPAATVRGAAIAEHRAPRGLVGVVHRIAQDQLRLPFANGPPVA